MRTFCDQQAEVLFRAEHGVNFGNGGVRANDAIQRENRVFIGIGDKQRTRCD
jgi:hypothetical protein